MELEKTLTVAAPRQHVWDLLLDPKIMAGCVPGTQSVDVLSEVEYLAEIKVKISFIAARFKIKTRIVERRPPEYLRIEGAGEDSSVASSMKQSSELFLTDNAEGGTDIRIHAHADVLGRLGSFGLSVMKTKADRMWDEFGANFSAVALRSLSPMPPVIEMIPVGRSDAGPMVDSPTVAAAAPGSAPQRLAAQASAQASDLIARSTAPATWWRRIIGPSPGGAVSGGPPMAAAERLPTDIYVELQRSGGMLKVLWPASAAAEAAQWLKDIQ